MCNWHLQEILCKTVATSFLEACANHNTREARKILFNDPDLYNQVFKTEFFDQIIYTTMKYGTAEIRDLVVDFLKSGAKYGCVLTLLIGLIKEDLEYTESFLKNGFCEYLGDIIWKSELPAVWSCVFLTGKTIRKDVLKLLIKHGLNAKIQRQVVRTNLLIEFTDRFIGDNDEDVLEIAEILIDAGVPVNEADYFGVTPLSIAVLREHIPLVSLLIKKGSDVNQRVKQITKSLCSHTTPLHLAASVNNVALVELLISSGAEVDAANRNGSTPLLQACRQGSNQIVSMLIEKGADVNKKPKYQRSPLHLAVVLNNIDMVSLLLSKGANINAKDEDGCTVLHEACKSHFEDIVSLLLLKNADISPVNHNNKSPFSYLIPEKGNFCKCVKEMVKNFAKLSFKGIPILKADMDSIEKIPKSLRHFNECRFELNEMENLIFCAPYSFYSVLNNAIGVCKLAKLMKNDELVETFVRTICRMSYFESDLRRVFEEALRVRDRLETVVFRLTSIFNETLPEDVLRILAEFLRLEDLPME